MFNDQEKHISKGVILMISITEVARFRQQVIKYSLKNGVTKASIRYRVSRNSIYRWRKRYDGTWQSLKDRSHRPKSHPKQHTKQEHDLIMRYYHRNKDDKIVLWMKIREKGYKRSYAVMCQYIRRQGIEKIDKKKYRKNKPYMRAEYPGQKVQIDVKYVPSYCISNGKKYYYTDCAAASDITSGTPVKTETTINKHTAKTEVTISGETFSDVTNVGDEYVYYLVVSYVNDEAKDQTTTDAGKTITAKFTGLANGKSTLVNQ